MLAVLRFLIIALAALPTLSAAGTRLTYVREQARPLVIEIGNNGNVNAVLDSNTRLVIRDGETFVVEERLTGPLVTPLNHIEELLSTRSSQSFPSVPLVERGTAEINGRTGRAFYIPLEGSDFSTQPYLVISSDPNLARPGRAADRVFRNKETYGRFAFGWPRESDETAEHRWRSEGAPLRIGFWTLQSVEAADLATDRFALPAEPETQQEFRTRVAAEEAVARGGGANEDTISRAVFAQGRLWLLTDDGRLSSLAEGDAARREEQPGGPVLDLCVQNGAPTVLTGERGAGRAWTLRRWREGRWTTEQSLARAGDALVALSCSGAEQIVLTDRRLIVIAGLAPRSVNLSEKLRLPRVSSTLLVRPHAVFLGLNSGEWGGGLRRIDPRTGRITTLARNATGGLCDGPLNTSCDPVHGIALNPWRPDCVAVAVGLIHFMARGRITSVCPDRIEQLIAVRDPDATILANPSADEAESGGYSSVAFFGLAALGDSLIAVGHNGLYRIDARGDATHERWPRFVEIDGILLSFALPDVVLVMTELNRRASVSGLAPLLVVR